jgi:TonB family protein
MSVWKDKTATDKYGEKGKNGVIEITTKKNPTAGNNEKVSKIEVTGYGSEQKVIKEQYVIVEEMPQFPGGNEAMSKWISSNIKYPGEAIKKNITGKVIVDLIVGKNGKISNAKVSESVNPLLNNEAIRVINSMPDWKPGTQSGNPVEVYIRIPIDFKLK